MLLLGSALWLSLAQAGVTRHALIVGSNDGGAELPRLHYAEADAARFQQVLSELGGFAPDQITVLREPGRDELLSALRHHAWIAEQHPEDMFVFYYSGHADARGLRLGDETLPYTELRQGIRELPSEVRLGVLDACRSGEITRVKGLTLAEPFTSDDALNIEGEAWLTAAANDEDAQESDHLQGSFFTHYLVSGLRGAADQNDGMVSLNEAYEYAYSRTVARTGRTDAGTQHPAHDYALSGEGNLALTNVRSASAHLTLSEPLAGVFTILSLPDERPMVEVAKRADVQTVVALPPGQYLLRLSVSGGTREARRQLNEGSNHIVSSSFASITPELAALKGTGEDLPAEGAPQERPPLFRDPSAPRLVDDPEAAIDAFEARLEANGEWASSRLAGTLMGRALGMPPLAVPSTPAEPVLLVTPSAEAEVPPTILGQCAVVGPDCLLAEGVLAGASGPARLTFESGATAAEGTVRGGRPEGVWVFTTPEGVRFAEGSYRLGQPEGEWTWWFEDGQPRLQGSFRGGERSGLWWEFYDSGQKKSRTHYENGAPYGQRIEWYPDGRRESEGMMIGEQRFQKWTFYYPDGKKKARGSYDDMGRTGKWITWAEGGQISSKGTYWQDTRHGEWTFWWESGQRSSRGSYSRGVKVGHWESWHPNGQQKSGGDYKDNLQHGRWVEWYDNGELKVRGTYEQGHPIGRWIYVDPSGERTVEENPTRRQLLRQLSNAPEADAAPD